MSYLIILRRLCLLGSDHFVDDIPRVIGSEDTLSEMVTMYVSVCDHGFTAFWMTTCTLSADPQPVDAF
jgi:hypothetical protein